MVLLVSFALAQEPVQRSLPVGIPALHVQNPAGRLLVEHDPTALQSSVTVTEVAWAEGCRVEFSGDMKLAVVAVVRDEKSPSLCVSDVHVVLAGHTAVAVDQGRGRVEARGLQRGFNAELRVGRVRVDEVQGPVEVEVGLGGARMRWTGQYGGSAVARVRVGRVRAQVPYGTWLDHDVSGGVAFNPIPSGLESPDKLTAKATIVRVDTAQSAVRSPSLAVWDE